MADETRMTKGEREDLAKLARRREQVAKTATQQRAAELVADFEQQLASVYAWDDDAAWKAIAEEAQRAVRLADEQIAGRCRELGIPTRFRPGLAIGWHGRGENATASRRAELRAVARTRIDAMAKQAKTAIERASVDVQTQLIAEGLETARARAFLESMPSVEALMPPLSIAAIEVDTAKLKDEKRAAGILPYSYTPHYDNPVDEDSA